MEIENSKKMTEPILISNTELTGDLKQNSKFQRNSQIELMRILAMLMIVAHHYVYYGVYQNYLVNPPETAWGGRMFINKAFAHWLLPGGIVGVAMFFIIAGYFGIQSDKVKIKDIVYRTVTYALIGLILWLVLTALGVLPLVGFKSTFESVTKEIFPCASSTYWFVTIYIIIMLCKPAINAFYRKFSDKQLLELWLLLLLIYTCLRLTTGSMLGLYHGMTYYLAGVVLYRFQDKLKRVKGAVYIILGIVGWGGYAIFDAMSSFGVLSGLISTVIMGTISAVGFSAFFICGKVFSNTTINKIGASTLSVYLIHENPLLREVLWSKILNVETVQIQSILFPLWGCVSVVGVFAVCIVIDMVKNKTLDKVGYKLINQR